MRGTAKEYIPYGSHVLCRNFEVTLADPSIANGIARDERAPWSRDDRRYHPGDAVIVDAVQGLGERDLKAIANGPIMEPLKLYLPAGKLTEAEYQERLKLDFAQAGISPDEVRP